MAKTPLEKQLNKMQRDAKKQTENEIRSQRASAIVSGQPVINGMRIMDDTAEIVLKCLLDMRESPEQIHISYDYSSFPESVQRSLSLEMEKLIQYGMVTSVLNWLRGGMLDLLPPAFTYFDKKANANEGKEKDGEGMNSTNKKVFIVHGHNNEAKQETARVLEKAGFEAVILHEQADGGDTIIEKIERYTDVSFAVVLYTECDWGRAKEEEPSKDRLRARQNVVFEHGYLIGKLGRKRVCAIVKGNVETPGDISGVVYTPMDANGAWKVSLARNMRDAGLTMI